MDIVKLSNVANKMVEDNKGLLAADESTGTIAKRLSTIGVESTEDYRRDYREMLFKADGLSDYISGVILFDETIRQKSQDGKALAAILSDKGIMPGIKVDKGAKSLAGHDEEKVTEGLDGLVERVEEYVSMGAKFAKWRAVITIGDRIPTSYCIKANAHALARYARICQEGGLVPIVEPEVLMDGAHSIAKCEDVTKLTLKAVFNELFDHSVDSSGIVLKPNMVISGKNCQEQAGVEEVADRTIAVLLNCVPASVPGIMFLSGGQSEIDATIHLNEMNKQKNDLPWSLSYSYGRALQESALKVWGGDNNNNMKAQEKLLVRARQNSLACSAKYDGEVA